MEKESVSSVRQTAVIFLLVLSALSSFQNIHVTGAPSSSGFRISQANPSSLTVTLGGSNTSITTVQKSGAFSGVLALTATALPPTLIVSMDPTTIIFPNGNSARSTLRVSTGPLTLPGTYNVTIVATDGTTSSAKEVPVSVPFPDFTLHASPTALPLPEGSSGGSKITVAGENGFSGSVSLQASSNPNGPIVNVNPTTVTILLGNNTTSTLTVSTTCDTVPGTYDVGVTGSSVGFSEHSTNVTVTVTEATSCHPPFSVTVSCGSATAAKPVTCDASTSGGTQPYTFSWYAMGGSPEAGAGTGSSFTTTFATKGTYTVNVTVTDSFGANGSGSATTTVVVQPLTIALNCGIATAGEPVNCNATVTGGTSPYTITWSAISGTPSTGTGNSFTTTFAVKGTYTVSASVTDANRVTQLGSAGFTVTPQTLVPSFTFSPASPVSHETVTFTGSATGGTSPYSYSWNFGDSASGTGVTVTHVYLAKTTAYHVILTATDLNGVSSIASEDVSVSPDVVSVSVACGSAISGEPVTCNATPSGGIAPVTISWSAPNGTTTTSTGASFTTIFTAIGTYTVTAAATDSNGATGSGYARVAVLASSSSGNPPPANTSPTSSPPPTPLLGFNLPFAILLAGNLLMAALILTQVPALRRKRAKRQEQS